LILKNGSTGFFGHIADGYPKYLITMDKLLQKRNGIKHLNIVDMMLDKTDL